MENTVAFKNIVFDKSNKTFTIADGTKGTFSYTDIINCSIANEEAKHRGKGKPFEHLILDSVMQPIVITNKYVYVGVIFELKDKSIVYVYTSDEKTPVQTLQYYDDRRDAEKIKEFAKKIINKYNPKK